MLQSDSSLKNVDKWMNFNLKNLSQWLKAKKLSLNFTKTELIIFHSSSKKIDHNLEFKLDEKRLTPTSAVKYLGVLLDNHLLWLKQINDITTLVNTVLSKLRNNTSLKTLKMTYHSLFSSHLLHGSQLCYGGKLNQPKQNTKANYTVQYNFV